jgi:hypothetical protein
MISSKCRTEPACPVSVAPGSLLFLGSWIIGRKISRGSRKASSRRCGSCCERWWTCADLGLSLSTYPTRSMRRTCHICLYQVKVCLRHAMTTYQEGSGIKMIVPTQIIHADTFCARVFIAENLLSMTDSTSAISLWPISNYCDDSRYLLWAAPCSSFRRVEHFRSHLSNQMCQISKIRRTRITLIE